MKEEKPPVAVRVVEIKEFEVDPEVWGKNFPREYDTYQRNKEMKKGDSKYGGSEPFDKLKQDPKLVKLFAGMAFSKEYKEDRGHTWTIEDVTKTQRKKPSASCMTCKSGNVVELLAKMGPDAFYATPFEEIVKKVKYTIACIDCHDPKTMDLKLTRPALINALKRTGKDPDKLTRQEMRTLVCAQCHVEYYLKPKTNELIFPWDKGMSIDQIEAYYDEVKFKDWTHPNSGADLIKIQHPEYELFMGSIHQQAGLACPDCHMPYLREGGAKFSSHYVASPLNYIHQGCTSCHREDAKFLKERVFYIQDRTANLLDKAAKAIISAIDAIEAASKTPGVNEKALDESRKLHRKAQIRWDWIAAENSTGFHNSPEAMRVLGDSIDLARQAELTAVKAAVKK